MENSFKIKIKDKELIFNKKVKILDLIEKDKYEYIAATVNNRLRELDYEIYYDAEVILLTKKDYLAIKPYETSLRYIIAMACAKAFPSDKVKFSYNISRSIYVQFNDPNKCFNLDKFKLLNNQSVILGNQAAEMNHKI